MPHTSEHKIPIEEIFQQSPIPDVYRGYISPGPAGILDDPPKKEKKVEKEAKDKGGILKESRSSPTCTGTLVNTLI